MKCALVGCGYWGEKVLSALCKPQESRDLGVLEPYGKGVLHSAEFELVGVYDSHLDNAQKARESCPSVHIYPSFEALLADRQIQAVFIITPPASHFALAKAALEAKKHIFVEKPLALSSKECALLYELAARQGVVVHCDHIFLYAPAVQWLKAHIHELGEICSIHARRESLGRLQKEVSVVWDLALHDIAILDYVLGAGVLEQMKPSARVVEAGGYRAVADIGLVDTRTTIAIHTSWLSPTKVREMVIVGRSGRGVIYNEVAENKLAMFAMDSALLGEDSALRDKAGSLWLASSIDTQVLSPCSPLHNPAFSSQILESTFDKNAKLQNEDSSPNAHFSVIASRDSGVAIHKGAKVDSSNDYSASAECMDSKETSANAERYPLFSKEATLCHTTATAAARNDRRNTIDEKVDSSKQAKNVSKQPKDSRIFTQNAPSVSDSQAAGFSKKTSANAKFCDNNAKAENVFDSHAAGGRIVDTNAELQKADSSKQPKDSRILEIESGLFKRVQRRILGVCNCSTRAEIADSSPKAESTKQKPMPESSQAELPTTPPLISSIAHFYAQITQGQICQELASHTLRVVQILEQIDVATLR
ncbi:Gfo/Idh/MocA family protein [Helicobacter zhangjianzhongii]|uniref:Gfo/Idh/MocA family oxidoreductase n=1 Tax=Helicobacter zhangjianzhongii TaxID=2974574 RepID=A0ACC6FQ50_9HELI|nr:MULTISPECIES: Gfo/Idh/MocA family oxidoreductase [unclassified Helicobacter]MDL0079274.1 Gfo/Idh/MocA family oxidoreductase [Helicobacter sp. CPD2-1]MDL0081305.1 Gfo/Idh/MocA family oxidoreductase [Helicobacter sp. XJK30-2]